MSIKPLILIAAAAAISFAGSSRAEDDPFVQISALFEAGWRPSIKGLQAAQALYQDLRKDGRIEPRVAYAYALVHMRNLKYDEARRLLDEVLAAQPHDTAARRAKVWVLMVTQDYSAGMVQLEMLAKSLAADKNGASAKVGDPEQVEFVGRVMGFLDGPAAPAVAVHVRDDYRKRLIALLSTGHRQAFEEGYAAVQRRFAELDLNRTQTKEDAKAKAQDRQDRILAQLVGDRAGLEEERSALKSQAEKFAADIKRELSRLDDQIRPIVTRQATLESQGGAITREMAGLQVEISRLLELAELAEDPGEVLRLRAAARRLSLALGRYDVDLRAVNGELAGLASQRVQLAAQRQALIARERAEGDRVERRIAELRTAERRVATQEKKANQPVVGNTPAVVALAAKAKAFTTYEAFPFEEERARLLQSLRRIKEG
jgi:hypothetical protein